MPLPAAIAASKAARLFSIRPSPCRPRCANGRATSCVSSACLDGDDGIDFDRGAERQRRHATRAAGVAAGLAEYLLHQFGGAVGDLGLVGEMLFRGNEGAKLDDPLDPVERPERLLHLRD